MTVWFVSRHPGALEWMHRQGIDYDRHVTHLDTENIRAGDTVIGSLPVNLAAEVCARGAAYGHLSLRLVESDRGRELSAEALHAYNAAIELYEIRKLP
jgi:CRISPR-associated protein Csx16